jgi:predicted nucleic acid binding AN1-type Zn finger protein
MDVLIYKPVGMSLIMIHMFSLQVCELHFDKGDIESEVNFLDGSLNKIVVPLKRYRLRQNAIPSIMPNCPSYLSTKIVSRESAAERRCRKEDAFMKIAVASSIASNVEYEKKISVQDFQMCIDKVKNETFNGWTVIYQEECIIFSVLKLNPVPKIIISAVIDKNLSLNVCKDSFKINSLNKRKLPWKIETISDIHSVLSDAIKLCDHSTETLNDHINFLCDSISSLCEHFVMDDNVSEKLSFISQQLKLITLKQPSYLPNFVVFCSILHSISPHAYKFLRHSDIVTIPHPKTLYKMCLNVGASPQLEQYDANFLSFIKRKFAFLEEKDKIISLMMDEIHIKPYMDYKGGKIVGMAGNCSDAATTIHVFMINSLLSSFKEVVHMYPVKNIKSEGLFTVLTNIIVGLEVIGFNVVCVVSDNNSINRKTMSFFSSPPKLQHTYSNPHNNSKPLYFILDSVHIFKCIRNNWINQKDPSQTLCFPKVDDTNIYTATFSTLKKLHEIENNSIAKHGYGLTAKSLSPNAFERQNVKLVLNVFNAFVVNALLDLGPSHGLNHYEDTSYFIDIIVKWWNVMNVKSAGKGKRLRDDLQNPLTLDMTSPNRTFLYNFSKWLKQWDMVNLNTNCLSKETHAALIQSTEGILELANYCLTSLKFEYFLPGKIQTDPLEARFGKYRMMAGSQYIISVRQVFECESKLRMQNYLPLTLKSSLYGVIKVNIGDILENDIPENLADISIPSGSFSNSLIDLDDINVESIEKNTFPVLVYLAGYCARITNKKLKCNQCTKLTCTDKELVVADTYHVIRNMDRGGLLYPQPDVVSIVVFNYLIIQKLIGLECEEAFLRHEDHKKFVKNITLQTVDENIHSLFKDNVNCELGHSKYCLINIIVNCCTNILLNNYVKKKNDALVPQKKIKLQTLQKF